jgi:DNA invertase Pin-like site-specific DNA recombinase
MKAAIYCRVSTEGQEQDGTRLLFCNLDYFISASEAT